MPGNEPVQALLKGLDIILALASSEDGMRLNELCESQGLNPSTAHNLVKTLRLKGFVDKGADGRLRVGEALKRLGAIDGASALRSKVSDSMVSLAKRLPNTIITFCEQISSEICVTLRLSPDLPSFVNRPVGMNFSAYGNVSGLAHQAFGDSERVSWLRLEHGFREEGSRYWASEDALDEYLDSCRARGFARSPFDEGACFKAAVPLRNRTGVLLGVLGVAVRDADLTASPETLETELLAFEAAFEK
jgi:DNA-binding IclR family transcriptional regulator